MNWQKRTDRDGVDYEVLMLPDGIHSIEVAPLGENGFWATSGGNSIGKADTLEGAKQLASAWLIEQASDLLKAAGAEGIWLVRGATSAKLEYYERGEGCWIAQSFKMVPPNPHDVLLVRLPVDGGESGIEQF